MAVSNQVLNSVCYDAVDGKTAKEVLDQAAQLVNDIRHRFLVRIDSQTTAEGVTDPVHGLTEATLTMAGKSGSDEFRLVGYDSYFRMGDPADDRWRRMRPEKLSIAVAPSSHAETLLQATTETVWDGGCRFSGMIKASALGDGGPVQDVPFEATVDNEGRLVFLKTTLPTLLHVGLIHPLNTGDTIELNFSEFGLPVSVERPSNATSPAGNTIIGEWEEVGSGHRLEIHHNTISWFDASNEPLCVSFDLRLGSPPTTVVDVAFICSTDKAGLQEDTTIRLLSDDTLEFTFHGVPVTYRRSA